MKESNVDKKSQQNLQSSLFVTPESIASSQNKVLPGGVKFDPIKELSELTREDVTVLPGGVKFLNNLVDEVDSKLADKTDKDPLKKFGLTSNKLESDSKSKTSRKKQTKPKKGLNPGQE